MPARPQIVYEQDPYPANIGTSSREDVLRRKIKYYTQGQQYSQLFNYAGTAPEEAIPFMRLRDLKPTIRSVVFLEKQDANEVEELEQRFNSLVEKWREETMYQSSMTNAAINTNYQQIIGMGPAALPLILCELRNKGGNWFWALRMISGEDPVPAESKGRIKEMTKYWLKWGKKKGYI